jgi:hypothetical protein
VDCISYVVYYTSVKGEYIMWKYGIVHKKLSNNESWYYVAEIYGDGGHSNINYLGGISGEDIQEIRCIVNSIFMDIMEGEPLVIEDVDND